MRQFEKVNAKRKGTVIKKFRSLNLKDHVFSFGDMGLADPNNEDPKVVMQAIDSLFEDFDSEVSRPKKLIFLPSTTLMRRIIRALHEVQSKENWLSYFAF